MACVEPSPCTASGLHTLAGRSQVEPKANQQPNGKNYGPAQPGLALKARQLMPLNSSKFSVGTSAREMALAATWPVLKAPTVEF